MYGAGQPPKRTTQSNGRLKPLLINLSDDEDEDPTDEETSSRSQRSSVCPWKAEFHKYLSSTERIPDGMDTVVWWDVSHSISAVYYVALT